MASANSIGFSNFASLLAEQSLDSASERLGRSLSRLSTGSRVGIWMDDPAGVAVSTRMRAEIRQQEAVQTNLRNALSYLQTQDGALQAAGSVLTRVSELSTLALDVTKSTSDLAQFDAELQHLRRQLSSLGAGNFNGISLFVQSPTGATAASTTDELLDLGVTVNGNSMSISKPALATSPWVDMLINGFVSFADPSDATRRIFVPNPPQNVKGYLEDGSEFDLDQTTTVTQNWTEVFSLAPGWNSRAATNVGGPITVAASVASPSVTAIGANTFQKNVPQAPYVTQPTYRELAESFRNNTLIDPLHGGTTTTSSITVGFSTTVVGATLNTPSQSATLTSTLAAWTNNPLAASAANVASGTLSRETAREIGTVAALAIESLAKIRASNGAQQSRLEHTLEGDRQAAIQLESAVSRIADVDLAGEMTRMARASMLQEAGAAMLGQANVSHQMVMRLLLN
jgi:flagellin-like hook-associated protein FlgL